MYMAVQWHMYVRVPKQPRDSVQSFIYLQKGK